MHVHQAELSTPLLTVFFGCVDMINMMKLGYVPQCCSWIYAAGDAIAALAV